MKYQKYHVTPIIESQLRQEEKGKEHASHLDPHYDKKIFELGTKWALEHKDVNDTKELAERINYQGNLSENKSFLNGYSRGLRLLIIEINETQQDNNVKRK